jgi:hypothetical protein
MEKYSFSTVWWAFIKKKKDKGISTPQSLAYGTMSQQTA